VLALAGGWIVFAGSAPPVAANVEPGLYLSSQTASPGQHIKLSGADVFICPEIVFSLAPADDKIAGAGDPRLTRVLGKVHKDRGFGATNSFRFDVPDLAPGTYAGYEACGARLFQRASNDLTITPSMPPTDTAFGPVTRETQWLLGIAFAISLFAFGRVFGRSRRLLPSRVERPRVG
jgi:hypothetical protein